MPQRLLVQLKSMCRDNCGFRKRVPPTGAIGNIDSSSKEIDLPSPIDGYVTRFRKILSYGTKERLDDTPTVGGLLLLGVVSAAECYFRSILSLGLDMCPLCRKKSADKQINLGGVLWHGQGEFRRSAFEHMSFSSAKELRNASREYLAYELRDAVFAAPLDEFDVACHLRHGLVHNGGILPGRNAVQIGIKQYAKSVEIVVDFSLLQRTVAAIDTLVMTFNRELFAEMCKRWAVDWRRRADWSICDEDRRFVRIWRAFSSNELNLGPSGSGKDHQG